MIVLYALLIAIVGTVVLQSIVWLIFRLAIYLDERSGR